MKTSKLSIPGSLILSALIFGSFLIASCDKATVNQEEEPIVVEEEDDEPTDSTFRIVSISGVHTQGGITKISGFGFSTVTDTTLYFTDFQNGTVGTSVLSNISWLGGDAALQPKNYQYSSASPLTGNRVARANADQTALGYIYANLPDLEECFVEFYAKFHRTDFTSSPNAPQIKYTRLCSGSNHTDEPLLGITIQSGDRGAPTLTYRFDTNDATAIAWPGLQTVDDLWIRNTLYMKLSTPGVANGMQFYRSTWTNQWTTGGNNYYTTPNEWAEPSSITRGTGVAAKKLKRMFFPFYQRADQSSIIDINHIYVHNSLERVYLSTSSTATASKDFVHVVCPTTKRTSTEIEFKSMIGCMPANAAVYLYVVNADNEMNQNGFLIRAAS